jgi:hypothetical protein
VPAAIANLREYEIAKAEKIAVLLKACNSAHGSEKFGIISVIGADTVKEDNVAKAAQGEIIPIDQC